MATTTPPRARQARESVVIRFAGDSGDGMQVTGSRFTVEAALAGNDLTTFPDFPAEIRAPAGTTYGVSAFQIHFGGGDVTTPGDEVDVLVAMTPAALKVDLKDLRLGGTIVVDTGAFSERNLAKAGFPANPIDDGSLAQYQVLTVDITRLTAEAVKAFGLSTREAHRCRNMWALGLMLWMYGRDRQVTTDWLRRKFADRPELAQANVAALNAGHAFGETAEMSEHLVGYTVAKAPVEPGRYRAVSGTEAIAWGLIAGMRGAGIEKMIFAGYPITPASLLLHTLASLKAHGVITFQAEDEIAAIEAVRIATKYMTPVILLSDAYLAHAAEPWRLPDPSALPRFPVHFRTDPAGFHPFLRDPVTLARAWAVPGTPDLEHRIGGLEKDYDTGHISYDPENHARMTRTPAAKIAGIANDIPPQPAALGDDHGAVAVVAWGPTYRAIQQAVREAREDGIDVSHIHLRYLNPFPSNLGDLLKRFDRVLVPEMNSGQLVQLLRAAYLVPAEGLNKVEGKPFKVAEIVQAIGARGGGRAYDGHDDHRRGAHPQGLRVGSGGPGVPRLWGLRDPQGGPESTGGRWRPARAHRVRFGNRLCRPVPVLLVDVRVPHHPRPGPGDRHRNQARQSRARRMGHHRRRRRPLDRRGPHAARAAPPRGSPDRPLQQPDLRAHPEAVLAHPPGRDAFTFHTAGLDREPPIALRGRGGRRGAGRRA